MTMNNAEDERVCVWPDGDWCYECDLSEMSHKSDDHQYIPAQFFFIDDEIFNQVNNVFKQAAGRE